MKHYKNVTTHIKLLIFRFIGKVLTEKTVHGGRRTVAEDNYDCHCFVREDNLAGVLIADKTFSMTDSYVVLERMLDDFTKQFPSDTWEDLSDDKVLFPLNEYFLKPQGTNTNYTSWKDGDSETQREEFEPLVVGNLDYTTCLQNLRNTVQYRQRVSLNQPLIENHPSTELKDPFEKGTCSGCVIS